MIYGSYKHTCNQFAAGETPPIWRKFWWCLSVLFSLTANKNNQDAYTLSWQLTRVAEGKSWLCDLIISFWRKKFRQQFPGGISEVLENYFGFRHPLCDFLKESK